MREILFRGKRTYNGKWVEGFYHCAVDKCTLKNHCYITTFMKLDSGEIIILGELEVTPDTVGQYTGLTDKNGKMIFEGDIVKHYSSVYEISYITKYTRFAGKGGSCIFAGIPLENTEVIGNVHDNPELLEGGEGE